MSVIEPHLSAPGELAPPGTKTYYCDEHGQTLGAWHCAACSPGATLRPDAAGALFAAALGGQLPRAFRAKLAWAIRHRRWPRYYTHTFGDATAAQIGTQELNR